MLRLIPLTLLAALALGCGAKQRKFDYTPCEDCELVACTTDRFQRRVGRLLLTIRPPVIPKEGKITAARLKLVHEASKAKDSVNLSVDGWRQGYVLRVETLVVRDFRGFGLVEQFKNAEAALEFDYLSGGKKGTRKRTVQLRVEDCEALD